MTQRVIHPPRGTKLTCKNWLIEAPYRMIQHNLDPEVAGDPDNLIVYGGRGRAARNWAAFDAILRALRELENDETLLVQSGKPVGVLRTHLDAPRVIIANSNIVPAWATQENFDRWEAEGLIMYGQMTAGSWIYIGTQGILQGTYETLGALALQHDWPDLKGKFVLTAGLGEMGGAQPLAVTMNGGVGLIVEVDRWRAERRLSLRQVDAITDNLEEAMTWVEEALADEEAKSVGLIANAAEALPELVERAWCPTWSPIRPRPTIRCTVTFRPAWAWRRRPNCAGKIQPSINAARWSRWPGTCRRCSTGRLRVASFLTTATICASEPTILG